MHRQKILSTFAGTPSFAWPQALGVGYNQVACNVSQCPSGNALNDHYHQFPADSRVAAMRANPLQYTNGIYQDIVKTSMLYGDCDDSCRKGSLAEHVRYALDWGPFDELLKFIGKVILSV